MNQLLPVFFLFVLIAALGSLSACDGSDGDSGADAVSDAETSDATDAGDTDAGNDVGGREDGDDGDAADATPAAWPFEGPVPVGYNTHPEPPALLRDVAMVDDDNEWTAPFVPGLRTTQDGRVGLRVQGGPSTFSFYLLAPESLDEPIVIGAPGVTLLADPNPVVVEWPPAADPNHYRIGHHTICDPTAEFAVEGEQTNPYACGPESAHDCYDFTIISSITEDFGKTQMWGTPIHVEVSAPKTADASIASIQLGEPVPGTILESSLEWAEVAVTIDGRLLSGRWGGFIRDWTHPQSGEVYTRQYDLGYSVLSPASEPCDVTGWTDFHPISHAPYDPNLQGRYGVAAYPFRDSEGQIIADGEDMGGSYPWMDREGSNVFMTGIPGVLHEQPVEDFPRQCVVAGCESFEHESDFDRGFLVAGLWTHGRLVHLDSRINNMDWSVGLRPDAHMWVDLYQTEDGEAVPVRFGAGRGHAGNAPPGHPGNENILDSLQNMPNFAPAARTVTPRDVVWVMSTGVATDEVVFDDFLDPRALIVSSMQPSITQVRNAQGHTTGIPIHWNGQVREVNGILPPVSNLLPYDLVPGERADVHIQNAATSTAFEVPAYGLVEAGTGRTEPVALGGFYGRGFWLDGANRIRYAIPTLEAELTDVWYVSIFVDVRSREGATRALLTFPDGSSIRLIDDQRLEYLVGEEPVHSVTLRDDDTEWVHLAWRIADISREITLYVDGYAFDRFASADGLFGIGEGELIVGRGADLSNGHPDVGVRGWVDEFKVLAHDVDPEVACNHAGGTLVRVDDSAVWSAVAAEYPDWAHEEVASAAALGAGTFVCFHDHSADYAAHLQNTPEGTTPMRDAVTFPEGPLRAGAPRPDSSGNAFCLSCHHDAGLGGLGLDALTFDPNLVHEHDPRRQPLQPLRRVFGNIPAGWIPAGEGPGSPAEAFVAPPEGALIDPWMLPGMPGN